LFLLIVFISAPQRAWKTGLLLWIPSTKLTIRPFLGFGSHLPTLDPTHDPPNVRY
jgi:hypothetical protein